MVPTVEFPRPEGELKSCNAVSALQVVKDRKCNPFLARQNPNWEIMGLYAVTFQCGKTFYVLAESAGWAINEATCGLNRISEEDRKKAEAHTWAGRQF